MTTFELTGEGSDPASEVSRFRALCDGHGLVVGFENSLAAIPGSVHLHLRKRGERSGSLEYTMDVANGRSWLSYHENRFKPWMREAIESLIQSLGRPSVEGGFGDLN